MERKGVGEIFLCALSSEEIEVIIQAFCAAGCFCGQYTVLFNTFLCGPVCGTSYLTTSYGLYFWFNVNSYTVNSNVVDVEFHPNPNLISSATKSKPSDNVAAKHIN